MWAANSNLYRGSLDSEPPHRLFLRTAFAGSWNPNSRARWTTTIAKLRWRRRRRKRKWRRERPSPPLHEKPKYSCQRRTVMRLTRLVVVVLASVVLSAAQDQKFALRVDVS